MHIIERFWSKVKKSPGCWLWMAGKDCYGYGVFAKTHSKTVKAHRFAYEITFGPIKDGLFACHTCDNPGCVSPHHIFLGTNKDNQRDKTLKGRGPIGTKSGRTFFTDDDVKWIRELLEDGWYLREIATLFGVTIGTIAHIKQRRTWKHI